MAYSEKDDEKNRLEEIFRSTYKDLTGQSAHPDDSPEVIFKKSLKFLLNIIDQMPGRIWWQDKNNTFLGCNDTVAKSGGFSSSAEVVGKTNYDFPWREQAAVIDELNNEVIRTQKVHKAEEFGYTGEHPEGGFYYCEKKPLFNEEKQVIGTFGIAIDITERKKLEDQLKIANELKTQFVQNMQHDLRTPTSGSMVMLKHLAAREQDPEKKKDLIMLYKASKKIYNICNEIINFDQIAQHINPVLSKKFNLYNLIQDVIELNHPAAKMRGLDLSYTIDPKIPEVLVSDPKRLSRVLINLVGNAIKFTEKGSVELAVEAIDLTNTEKIVLEFKVIDTGIGIPEDKKDWIYEQFSRLTPSSQGYYAGSGLGLNIVKHYVEDLKGEIEVESELNKGTIFHVTFSFQKPLSSKIYDKSIFSGEGAEGIEAFENTYMNDMTTQNSLDVQPGELQILMIEDSKMALMAALMTLKDAVQSKNTSAENVSDALKLLKKKRFDLVISDLGLPDGEGMDIARAVKVDPNSLNYNTPFFALTAHSDRDKKAEAEAAGFDIVMTKPLSQPLIKSLIDAHILKKTSVKEASSLREHTDIIDLELGEELIGHRHGLALELLNMLAAELPKDMLLIQDAFEHNNVERLRAELHKFKGGLSHCGVPRLQIATTELESLARNVNNLVQLKELMQTFFKEANLFLDLHEHLRKKEKVEEK